MYLTALKKSLLLLLLLGFLPLSAHAKTEVHLVDFSGSISDCQSLMRMNLQEINRSIDALEKNDRFLFFGYRSQGKPVLLAEIQMPQKRGPRDRDLQQARQLLRQQIKKNLASLKQLLKNSGADTDIVGALNHVLLFSGDLAKSDEGVYLYHYSDGIHTSRTGRFDAGHYEDYLRRLNKRLEKSHLVRPVTIDGLSWRGGLCLESMNVPLEDSAFLQSELRSTWLSFLQRETPSLGVEYKLSY